LLERNLPLSPPLGEVEPVLEWVGNFVLELDVSQFALPSLGEGSGVGLGEGSGLGL